MRRLLAALLTLIVLSGAAIGAGYFWLLGEIDRAGPLATETSLVIPRGAGMEAIAEQLQTAGLLRHTFVFFAASRLQPGPSLKAGEYAVPAAASTRVLLALLRSGRTVIRRLTIPEGLTVREVFDLLAAAPALEGSVPSPPPAEGSLLPETYFYSWGDSRAALANRMREAMDKTLAEAWAKRLPDLPIKTPTEALTLASIIEKETGKPEERAQVAGVYMNRLRIGMRLQADPTVIHGITLGQAALGRELTRADLDGNSPYNTYKVVGLPPGPIANPGPASILAATRPAATKALYFVADGAGGHLFAETLAEHNRNVARWRRIQAGEKP